MSILRCNCTINIEFSDPQLLKATEQALKPEVQPITTNRVSSHIESRNNSIFIHITATDLVGLRAVVNSFLKWISNIQDVLIAVL